MALTYTGVACFLFCIIIIIVNFDIGQHAGGWEPRLYLQCLTWWYPLESNSTDSEAIL